MTRVLVTPFLTTVEHGDPSMVEGVLCGGAFVRGMDQQDFEKRNGSIGDGVGPERAIKEGVEVGAFSGDDWSLSFCPGRVSGQKFEQDDAH